MRVLVAGASGTVGKVLVPALVARGHRVLGLVRSQQSASLAQGLGAQPVIADALDQAAVMACAQKFQPDAVARELTALPASTDLRHFAKVFEQTNRLRTAGLDNLLAAARAPLRLDDRRARWLECQVQAHVRVAAAVRVMARRFPARTVMNPRFGAEPERHR
jgi:nucleoside-diphosphate-sugar epimerase